MPSEPPATLSNFLKPPYNRWAFQHIRELFPTRAARWAPEPSVLTYAPRDLSDVPVAFADGSTGALRAWLDESCTDGFLVLKDGAVVFEHYANDQTPETVHIVYSVTKSVTGVMVLMLVEQGALDLNAPVASILPDLAASAFCDATVQHLMDMSNSLDFVEDYVDLDAAFDDYTKAVFAGGIGIERYLMTLTAKEHGFEHGDALHYATPTAEVLGWIVRQIRGQTLAAALHDMIWRPMGAEHEAHYFLDAHGCEMAGGGLSMSLRDMARFGRLIAEDGRAGNTQVVPPDVVERILTRRNPEIFAVHYENDPWFVNVGESYSDQWWRYRPLAGVLAVGVFGQYIYANPNCGLVLVRQASGPDAGNDPDRAFSDVAAAVERALAAS